MLKLTAYRIFAICQFNINRQRLQTSGIFDYVNKTSILHQRVKNLELVKKLFKLNKIRRLRPPVERQITFVDKLITSPLKIIYFTPKWYIKTFSITRSIFCRLSIYSFCFYRAGSANDLQMKKMIMLLPEKYSCISISRSHDLVLLVFLDCQKNQFITKWIISVTQHLHSVSKFSQFGYATGTACPVDHATTTCCCYLTQILNNIST